MPEDPNTPPTTTYDEACTRCARLCTFLAEVQAAHPDYWCRPVPPFGETSARLVIVGLAPGMHGANASGRPFTGDYTDLDKPGVYRCAACGAELFASESKFHSGCGWPSFDKEIAGGKIKTHVDSSHGMIRTEITCAKCGGHLGHLFDDGPTETGMRYCVNSVSIDFKKQ